MEIQNLNYSAVRSAATDGAEKPAEAGRGTQMRQTADAQRPDMGPLAGQPKAESARGEQAGRDGRERLDEAVSHLNDYVQNHQRDLKFNVDDVTGQTVIKVVDSETEQVIRQIPQEEVLELARFLKEQGEGKEGGILRVEA